ncbi:MAG: hypothetical protein ACFFGZ_12020 [Candidatus Thorarchaeota archaeon]
MLPRWYVLAEPPDIDIDLAQWQRLGHHRSKLLEESSSSVSEAIHKHIDTRSIAMEGELGFGRVNYEESFKGHLLLRLAAATSDKLKSWLVETEGDIFDYTFSQDNLDRQRAVLKDIFGAEHVRTLLEFNDEFDVKFGFTVESSLQPPSHGREFICVHYTQIPEMLSWRRMVEMHKGWIIARPHEFRGSLKRQFEHKLENEIEDYKNRLDEIGDANPEVERLIRAFAEDLEEHVQLRSKFMMPELEGKELQTKADLFPPCMRILIAKIENTGYLTHFERLELGFFLKKVGMSVDEQLRFWYEKSVDNVGLEFEKFVRLRGYQIRHIYGLVGGRKDYDVPKCRTLARGYFCPFVHLSPENLEQALEEGLPGSAGLAHPDVEAILRLVMNHRQTEACGRTFTAVYGAEGGRRIFHPIQWVKEALEIQKPSTNQANG